MVRIVSDPLFILFVHVDVFYSGGHGSSFVIGGRGELDVSFLVLELKAGGSCVCDKVYNRHSVCSVVCVSIAGAMSGGG